MCELVELQDTLSGMLGEDTYAVIIDPDISIRRGRQIIVSNASPSGVIPYLKGLSDNHKKLTEFTLPVNRSGETILPTFEPLGFVGGGIFTEDSVTKVGNSYNFVGMKTREAHSGDYEISCRVSSTTKDYTYLGFTRIAGVSGRALDVGIRVRSGDSVSLMDDGRFEEVYTFSEDNINLTLRKVGRVVTYLVDGEVIGTQELPLEDAWYFQADLYRGKQTLGDLHFKVL